MNKKFYLILTLLVVASHSTFARDTDGGGSEGGGGAGVLARLLVFAQSYLVSEIATVEGKIQLPKELKNDLAHLDFIPVAENVTLKDPHFGYKTWIRILPGSPIKIEYNPSPEYYAQIVTSLGRFTRGPEAVPAPLLRDVLGFLLHELGHHYGMKEEDAWKFAFSLQKALEENSSIKPLLCRFAYQDILKPLIRREFLLRATDEVRLRSESRDFYFSHVFMQTEKPQFKAESFGSGLRFALRADANSPMDYAQETPELKFSIHCQPQEKTE